MQPLVQRRRRIKRQVRSKGYYFTGPNCNTEQIPLLMNLPSSQTTDQSNRVHRRPGFIGQYSTGFSYLFKGIAYLKKKPELKKYLFFPFVLSALLYITAFFLFIYYSDSMVLLLLPMEPQGWFYESLWYLLKFLAYACVLTFMFFSSVIVTNIICSPFYDYVSKRIEMNSLSFSQEESIGLFGDLRQNISLCVEEIKKALFILVVPSVVTFIPIIGPGLAFILAMVFIAWEYIDFSLSRENFFLRSRLKVVFANFFFFLGFGSLLLVPVLNLFLFPVAIVGATLLYKDEIRER